MLGVSAVALAAQICGCATAPGDNVLADPLKQRLLAREDISLQNVLLARTPALAGSAADAPFYGAPPVEPPLPDLSLLPEDLPPAEEIEPLPPVP